MKTKLALMALLVSSTLIQSTKAQADGFLPGLVLGAVAGAVVASSTRPAYSVQQPTYYYSAQPQPVQVYSGPVAYGPAPTVVVMSGVRYYDYYRGGRHYYRHFR